MAVPDFSSSATWVICLCADWCGLCRDYRALFESVAARHPALHFAWVDIEDHAALVGDRDIETFPTLLIANDAGIQFHGPLTPHADTLSRLLGALQAPGGKLQAHHAESRHLLKVLPDLPQLWVKS